MVWRASCFWQDFAGRERETRLTSTAGAPNTFASLLLLSAASCIAQIEGPLNVLNHLPYAPHGYDDCGYMLYIDVQDYLQNSNRILVPAPLITELQPDQQTYDNLSAWAVNFATAAEGTLVVTNSGGNVVQIGAGWVMRNAYAGRETYALSSAVGGNILREMEWLDIHGNGTVTRIFANASPGAVMYQIENGSTAGVQRWWESVPIFPVYIPPASVYRSVLDAARLQYRDAAGNVGSLLIPAPVSTMFYADQETVDLQAPVLAGLLAAGLSELAVESSGAPAAAWIGGRRVKASGVLGI